MAASYNKVILIGNLTRDPQIRYTPKGTAVAEIGLAVNRTWFDQATNQKKEETTFVDVTLWGRQAEIAGEYLSKGRSCMIEGRLNLDTWDDKESGQKRSKLKVVCEQMQLLGSREGGGAGGGGGGGGARTGAPARRPQGGGGDDEFGGPSGGYSSQNDGPPPGDFPDDDVPF
ncbi:MAG: ssb [Planctomycetaceae bacterium]|nr:ssb [Planctomycetaceae bacterium]